MRKLRTRQHIIEDLGFNHIERQALYAGYTIQRFGNSDYGYDGTVTTFNEEGEIENLVIHFQLKSTDHINTTSDNQFFVFDVSTRDLELWLQNRFPVMFLLYDAVKEVSYYLDIQEYFQKDGILLKKSRKFVRIKIPIDQVWSQQNIIKLRHIKNQSLYGNA